MSTLLNLTVKLFGYVAGTDIARYQAEASLGVAEAQSMSAVEQKWSFVAFMLVLIALPVALYIFKAIGWDNVIAPLFGLTGPWGSTPVLKGNLNWVLETVVAGLFLHAVIK